MDDIERPFPGTVNIKQLIETFETRSVTPKLEENNVTSTNTSHKEEISNQNTQDEKENNDENENRITALRNTIHKDIDDSFDINVLSPTSNLNGLSERKMSTDDPTVDKFRTYIRNVSVYEKSKKRRHSRKSTLFDCCLIVEWNADVRRIKFKYPHDVSRKVEFFKII